MRDPYDILGIKSGASDDEIRKAYRKLAREHHPDVNPGDTRAEDKFKEVSSAYEVLSDPEKRRLYDEFGSDGLRSGFDAEQARAYQQWSRGFGGAGSGGGARMDFDGPGGFAGGFDMGDIFGDMFGAGSNYGQRPRRGRDVKVQVEISLNQALSGAEIQVAVPGRDTPVSIRIPKGANTGSRLRVDGKGSPSPSGGSAGDLIIETRVNKHPFFERRELDLLLDLPVSAAELYSGASISVPTPTGNVTLKIPRGSQPGDKLRLRGKGVQRGNKTGDLLVILKAELPKEFDDELAKKLEALDKGQSAGERAKIRF